jgi:hypothetical protein
MATGLGTIKSVASTRKLRCFGFLHLDNLDVGELGRLHQLDVRELGENIPVLGRNVELLTMSHLGRWRFEVLRLHNLHLHNSVSRGLRSCDAVNTKLPHLGHKGEIDAWGEHFVTFDGVTRHLVRPEVPIQVAHHHLALILGGAFAGSVHHSQSPTPETVSDFCPEEFNAGAIFGADAVDGDRPLRMRRSERTA